LKPCIAIILHVDSFMVKAEKPNVNNGLDTSHNKAVNLAG
jgi:hypothetical protein